MSDNFIGFGQGDEIVTNSRDLEFYKGEKNSSDIVSLCWFFKNEDGTLQMGEEHTPQFKISKYHYVQGKGYIDTNPYLVSKDGPPKLRFGTFIVRYKTNRKGEIQAPLEYDVMPWAFGEDKFRKLGEIHKDFPLTKHDFRIMCEDDQFQKLTFFPVPKGSLWQRSEELRKDILAQVEIMSSKLSLSRTMSTDDLKEHYGEDNSPVPEMSTEVNYDDLLDGLS